MFATTFKVVLDACVLYPFTLRDTLLRAAHAGLYQVYWSHEILDETTRNLIKKGLMNQDQAEHLVEQMEKHFPEALVEGYEPLVEAMPNDPKDRQAPRPRQRPPPPGMPGPKTSRLVGGTLETNRCSSEPGYPRHLREFGSSSCQPR